MLLFFLSFDFSNSHSFVVLSGLHIALNLDGIGISSEKILTSQNTSFYVFFFIFYWMKINHALFIDCLWIFWGFFCSGFGSVIGKILRNYGVFGMFWEHLSKVYLFSRNKIFLFSVFIFY